MLERARLLAGLPEAAGYVVVLSAPYGYGKSVLAAQWAARLEGSGWRVLWAAPAGRDLVSALGRTVGFPDKTPWTFLLEELWRLPTLLVLEDLTGEEHLEPLLRGLGGLLLLASRKPLACAGLLELQAKGAVLRFGAAELAFTREEARALIGDATWAEEVWRQSQGWPLPLHLAALTGKLPEPRALLGGVRESVHAGAWEELLFLSALPLLPYAASGEATAYLAEMGFVQALGAGYRLHPLMAKVLSKVHPQGVREAVAAHAPRLPPLVRGAALEHAGLLAELAALFDDLDEGLVREDPAAVLRWDARLPHPRTPLRAQQVGRALCLVGRAEEGIALLTEAAEAPAASPEARLVAYGQLVWQLAASDPERAREVAARAEPLLAQADPECAGRFLSNAHRTPFRAGAWAAAEAVLRRALRFYPPASPYRAITESNLAVVRWHRLGDLEGVLRGRAAALKSNLVHRPGNVPGDALQLGELKLLCGAREAALEHFREARRTLHADPQWGLLADAQRAALEGELGAFAGLAEWARPWPQTRERIVALWARALREHGDRAGAQALLADETGFWSRLERALNALGAGDRAGALAALPPEPDETAQREPRLYYQAARYRITRKPADLAKLLHLTLVRERVLPGLVPLAELPKSRPELAATYPLREVLASGWKAAIALRLSDLPPLKLHTLGGVEVWRFDEPLPLTPKLKTVLALFALRWSRERVAETLWPDLPLERAKNNLYVSCSLLRKLLEPWGVPTYLGDGGLLRTDADLWRLEQAFAAGDAEAVLALYRGPFAPEVDLPAVDEVRRGLHDKVVETLFRAARGAGPLAEDLLKRALALEPLHEHALQELLKRLLRRGRRVEALRRYHEFAKRLAEETGLEPLPETQEIVKLT